MNDPRVEWVNESLDLGRREGFGILLNERVTRESYEIRITVRFDFS